MRPCIRGVLDDIGRRSWHWFGLEIREKLLASRVYNIFRGAVLVCCYVLLSTRW